MLLNTLTTCAVPRCRWSTSLLDNGPSYNSGIRPWPQILNKVREGLRPARLAQHHVVSGRYGQPRHSAADIPAANEADGRHVG
jgi:hypothetical protein